MTWRSELEAGWNEGALFLALNLKEKYCQAEYTDVVDDKVLENFSEELYLQLKVKCLSPESITTLPQHVDVSSPLPRAVKYPGRGSQNSTVSYSSSNMYTHIFIE